MKRLRRALQVFFDKYEVPWEISMVVLALIYITLIPLAHFGNFSVDVLDTLDRIELGVTTFFALEFTVRIMVAPSWQDYLKGHWLDLVAILPVLRWLRITRLASLFRLLRLARVARVFSSLDRLEVDFARFIRLNGLQWMMLILTGIMLISSTMLFIFERSVNTQIKTYWDALYASLVTWTSPGYGEIVPLTTNGRICGLILIISGLFTWGILIANLAAFLTTRTARSNNADPAVKECQDKLGRLDEMDKSELISLHGAIKALIDARLEEENSKDALS